MDKMKLAHDWCMKNADGVALNIPLGVEHAWQYADEMQKQFEKRKEMLVDVVVGDRNWQPDWSQASTEMKYFAVDENGKGYFYDVMSKIYEDYQWVYDGYKCTELIYHGYVGDWKDSLRKRPDNE